MERRPGVHHELPESGALSEDGRFPPPFPGGAAEDRVYLRFQTGWASKYECEGLDLWDGSLCAFVPEIQYREWVGKIWYGVSTDHQNHAELKYRLDYVKELGNWTVMPWYEHSFVFPETRGFRVRG